MFQYQLLEIWIAFFLIIIGWLISHIIRNKKERKKATILDEIEYEKDEVLTQWIRVFISRCLEPKSQLLNDTDQQQLRIIFTETFFYEIRMEMNSDGIYFNGLCFIVVLECQPPPSEWEIIYKKQLNKLDADSLKNCFLDVWKQDMKTLSAKLIINEKNHTNL